MRHHILNAKQGDRLTIGREVHEVIAPATVQNRDTVPVQRVLIWKMYGEKEHFLMATFFAQDNQEFLGYTPVWGVAPTDKGFGYY